MVRPSRTNARPKRVRCHAVHSQMTQASKCRIRVELEWVNGNYVVGESEGISTPQGILRAGAEATLKALSELTEGRLSLRFRGVKLVRAFDADVVILSLRGSSDDRRYELIGSTQAPEGDLARGAAFAVLDATNRIFERYARPEE